MTDMEASLYQYFLDLPMWPESRSTVPSSTAYGIKEALKLIYGDRIHIIGPDISNGKSPAFEDETSGVLFYILAINQSLMSDRFALLKPLVAFWESKISESNSLWQMMVILPKNHTLIDGKALQRASETVFLIDSFGLGLQLPKLMKYLIQTQIVIREKGPTLKCGGFFPNVNIEEKSLKLHVYPHESGVWSIFNAIMLISSGSTEFLEPFSKFDPCFSLKLSAILDEHNIELGKSPNDLPQLYYSSSDLDFVNEGIRNALIDEILHWGVFEQEMVYIQRYLNINKLCTLWEYKQSGSWVEAQNFMRRIKAPLEELHKKFQSDDIFSTPYRIPEIKSLTPPTHQSIMRAKSHGKWLSNSESFKKVVMNKDCYIDKSLLIKEILINDDTNILILRPQKWGKTLNMNMLKAFFHPKKDAFGNFKNLYLFTGGKDNIDVNNLDKTKCLKIITEDNGDYYKNFAGKIPTIFLKFSKIKKLGNNPVNEFYLTEFSKIIKKAYSKYYPEYCTLLDEVIKNYVSKHPNIVIDYDNTNILELESIIDAYKITLPLHIQEFRDCKDNNSSLEMLSEAVPNLAKFAHKFYKQNVIIIVDDYDAPFSRAINAPHHNEALEIIENILNSIWTDLPSFVLKVIMVGILPIKGIEFSYMNKYNTFTIKNIEYSQFFGFTESEVNTLIERNFQSNTEEEMLEQRELIKLWYNGYNISGEKIYNPFSIMSCLKKAKSQDSNPLQSYWIFTNDLNQLASAFNALQSYDKLFELMKTGYLELSEEIYNYINLALDLNSTNIFFALLLHAGYLTPYRATKKEKENLASTWIYVVPNREIKKSFYNSLLLEWIKRKIGLGKVDVGRIVEKFNATLDDKTEFKNLIQSMILDKMTDYTSKTEADFQISLGGIAMMASIMTEDANYTLHSEAPNIFRKKTDGIFIPTKYKKTSVIIHEYKKLDTADANYVKEKAEDALWQIYAKQYMKIALDLRDSDQHYNYFDKMIVRGIVFFKAQYSYKWSMLIKEHSFDFNLASIINTKFSSASGGILAASAKLCGESGSQNEKIEERRSLGAERIGDLIKNIGGDSYGYIEGEEGLVMKRKLDYDEIELGKKPKLYDK
ncbi:unnamed protein product [Blepharisma stoltei]|uniref:AAA-ATPase-like domain-containing protein n=1 Tax=Blepharisma stoltei TaxID=1481888 RepID=A0AAU9IWH0_9CILI|nr:unnamed protein product [Blepharisma stoltei]